MISYLYMSIKFNLRGYNSQRFWRLQRYITIKLLWIIAEISITFNLGGSKSLNFARASPSQKLTNSVCTQRLPNYSKCCSSPMAEATSIEFSHIIQQYLTFKYMISGGRQSLYTSRPWGLKPLTELHKACLKSRWKKKKSMTWTCSLEPAVIQLTLER